jgi:hypothetical protein
VVSGATGLSAIVIVVALGSISASSFIDIVGGMGKNLAVFPKTVDCVGGVIRRSALGRAGGIVGRTGVVFARHLECDMHKSFAVGLLEKWS